MHVIYILTIDELVEAERGGGPAHDDTPRGRSVRQALRHNLHHHVDEMRHPSHENKKRQRNTNPEHDNTRSETERARGGGVLNVLLAFVI